MPQELISPLQRTLISSLHHSLPHSFLVLVEFQRIGIEGVDSDDTSHSFKEDWFARDRQLRLW